jgi:pyruvate dehydrogenase E2 component (dihydrolipoamide acetyltransferase)
MAAVTEVKVPDIGDFTDVRSSRVMVKAGDTVAAEDSLIALESDKATMEVPAPAAGTGEGGEGEGRRQGERGPPHSPSRSGRRRASAAAPRGAEERVSTTPPPTSTPGGIAEVRVPDIGDFKDVPVIEILVKPGDTVNAEDPLVTLESDKATMDVPSPLGGTRAEMRVKTATR